MMSVAAGYAYVDAITSEITQRESLALCCSALHVQLGPIYVDTASNRPALQQLLRDAASGAYAFAVAMKPESISCEATSFAMLSEALSKQRVHLIFASQVLEDLNKAVDRKRVSQIVSAQRQNAELGFFNGPAAPFGYEIRLLALASPTGNRRTLGIRDDEAGPVRRIFELSVTGLDGHILGLKAIALCLNADGLSFRGKVWNADRVNGVLRNELYKGYYYSYKTDTRTGQPRPREQWALMRVPPIVSETLWAAAQKPFWSRDFACARAFESSQRAPETGPQETIGASSGGNEP